MEYTDQQRVAFKDAYAERLRNRLIMIVLLFAVMTPLPFIEDWRCPACDNQLGRASNPKHCGRCGIELRA